MINFIVILSFIKVNNNCLFIIIYKFIKRNLLISDKEI